MDKHEDVWYESVAKTCSKYKIPFAEKTTVTEEDMKIFNDLSPDLMLSVGWRRIIPKYIFEIPKLGTINMHEGLIPQYRGFAPINWSIINGEKEIGITLHYLDETADTGDILLQKKIPIKIEDTASDVYNKLLELVPEVISEILTLIESNKIKSIPQKNLKGFFCSRRFPEDGKIDWFENRISVYNKIRALSDPYPNAFCYTDNQKIFVKKAQLINEDFRGPGGRVCAIRKDGIIVTCGNNHKENQAILITEISTEEKSLEPNEFFKLWTQLK